MSRDVEVDIVDGNEVIITKHRDTEEARNTVAAIRRAVELWNVKVANDSSYTEGAYGEDVDPDAADDDEDDEEIDGGEPAARERARRLQRDPAARAAASVDERTQKGHAMADLTGTVEALIYKGDRTPIAKIAAAEVARGISVFSSFERSAMIGALAKRQGDAKLSDAQKISRFLQYPDNRELLKWSLLRADVELISKRASLLDDTLGKRDHVSLEPAMVGGREATAVNRPRAADAARQRIIDEKRTAAPFMTDEQLERYADGMQAELDRMARAKQERARPGTLERV
jgi:hypothetical protein